MAKWNLQSHTKQTMLKRIDNLSIRSITFVIAMMMSASAYACEDHITVTKGSGFYLDASAMLHDEKGDSFKQANGDDIYNFIGNVEAGYEFDDNKSIFIYHFSSVQQDDTGLNGIGFRYRIF